MAPSRKERELRGEFARDYQLGQTQTMLEIESAVCGCKYGGTSWTTRSEAEEIGRLLGLTPGKRLLEVGAGSGWPGLYLAQITGCDLALVDVPHEALRIAAERAVTDQLASRCWIALADGAALPFADSSFDAISHSDVLCCLKAKQSVLNACKRVLGAEGRMAFTVISIAPNLSSADYERAMESGPPFVEAPTAYTDLLEENGWAVEHHADLTSEYAESARRLLRVEEARVEELNDLLGELKVTERLTAHRATLGIIEEGLLRRERFAATTTAPHAIP